MLTNKYSKLYFTITSNAKQRITEGYTETHHIIPQSLGGSNDKNNLVELTAREHFICHWLLIKMTEGDERGKMLYALQGMKAENKFQNRYHTKITARVYEKYRLEHAENHSKRMKGRKAWNKGIPQTEEHKEKNRQAALRRPPKTQETIEKWRKARTGYKDSEETKLKKSLALKGKPKGPMSEEEKLKRSIKQIGIKKTKSHAANVANAVKGNISINKDGMEKKVKKDTLQTYLDDGWQLGGKKRKVA
jgi:5-methylcytosine-specific restriction endonuclease McrA